MKQDLYEIITNRIIEQLEQGVIPWHKPWAAVATKYNYLTNKHEIVVDDTKQAVSYSTGKPYSILNQLFLGKPGQYITFKQVQDAGGRVNKGAKAKTVVYWGQIIVDKKDDEGNPILDDEGQPVKKVVPVLEQFKVFHLTEDTTGVKPRKLKNITVSDTIAIPIPVDHVELDQDSVAHKVFHDYLTRENIGFKDDEEAQAYYMPGLDRIHLPKQDMFSDISEYWSTAFHEATHSTGHASRLNRFTGAAAAARFGSTEYSKEELVAEIGSAIILNELGIETPETFTNSAAYIQNWSKALRDDKKMIVTASSKADKAARMILNIKEGDQE